LTTRQLGRRFLVFPRLDSTNSLALSLAGDPAHHGLVLLAEEQTAGRGQYGRLWQAPPRSSVLMSLLLFPPAELRRPAVLVAWAAVSVCELLRAVTGHEARIKWPNDVLVGGKKICGILIEQRASTQSGAPIATVVGIGLNVTQPADAFTAAGLPDAASLLTVAGNEHETEAIARQLMGVLDEEYGRLLEGDLATLELRWTKRLGVLGQYVCVEGIEQMVRGKLLALSFDGLELELASGNRLRLQAEAVRHIEPLEPDPGGAQSGHDHLGCLDD
jgi:BirA family biotin operon repressor/biotin-[acetyl-CoA-carboxylase] ligase